jgi:hypothetical protein
MFFLLTFVLDAYFMTNSSEEIPCKKKALIMFYSLVVPATPFWLQQNGKKSLPMGGPQAKGTLSSFQKLLFQFLKQTYLACLIICQRCKPTSSDFFFFLSDDYFFISLFPW